MTQYVVEGPVGAEINTTDSTPRFNLGARVVTEDTAAAGKRRVYRYLKHHNALAIGDVRIVGSTNELLTGISDALAITTGASAPLAVPHQVVASASGAQYSWVQRGGYFDLVDVKNASMNTLLYADATAGFVTSQPTTAGNRALVMGLQLQHATGTADGSAPAFSATEIFIGSDKT